MDCARSAINGSKPHNNLAQHTDLLYGSEIIYWGKRMRKFIFLLFALFTVLTAEAGTMGSKTVMSRTQKLAFVNQVVVEGRLNVNLHTGYRQPEVTLYGDPRDLAQVMIQDKQGRLVVSLGQGYPRYGQVSADIRTHRIVALTYRGAGTVKGMKLYAKPFDLDMDNSGNTELSGDIALRRLTVRGNGLLRINGVKAIDLKVRMSGRPRVELRGMANLASLDLKGDGLFSMYWVKSDNLRVRADDGIYVQLAGVANQLEVKLCGHAKLNARYLRARRLFVKTYDHSVAEVSAVKHQHTLASDASDIYFYNLSDTRTDFMAFNGAVLDMRPWNLQAREEYTRYNK